MSRVWAMPNADTFDVPDIGAFVKRYLHSSKVSIDPFARNRNWATYTNDIDPNTRAQTHLDAEEFLVRLAGDEVLADLAIFDPPYSPRQIAECYKRCDLPVSTAETQNAALYKRVRDALMLVLDAHAVVLSFGWNSAGMGAGRGFELLEVLMVAHGGAHNDTICIAERKLW
jgi:hypothetical protein